MGVIAVTKSGGDELVKLPDDACDTNDSYSFSRGSHRLLDAAMAYAAQGLSVLPLASRTKVPLRDSRGLYDATTDVGQIREWWRNEPQANIGVRTIGLAVVDLDRYRPGFEESWRRFIDIVHPDPLSNTRMSQTGRGGRHYWYRLTEPDDRYLKSGYASCLPINGQMVRLPHIDLKCSGRSYVVAPPSVISEGTYRWLQRGALADAPSWLRAPIPQRNRPAATRYRSGFEGSARRVAAILDTVAAAQVGQRNNSLNWGAYHLADAVAADVLSRDLAQDALLEAAKRVGLPSREARRTIRSAFRARGI